MQTRKQFEPRTGTGRDSDTLMRAEPLPAPPRHSRLRLPTMRRAGEGRASAAIPGTGERAGAPARSARGLAAVVLLAFAAFLALPSQAQAQSKIGLVSNIGQTMHPDGRVVGTIIGFLQFSKAQRFTTGDNADGYTLAEVVVRIHSHADSADRPRVSIYTDSSGSPGTLLYTFTNPASFGTGEMTFTAPADATLAKETQYFVVFEETSDGRYYLGKTTSDDEDSARSGWSIADTHLYRETDSGTWGSYNAALLINIKGFPSTDATLSGLALEDRHGAPIALTPATFSPNRSNYTAAVFNRTASAKLTATTTSSAATVVIENDDDSSTPNAAKLGLAVGSNTLRVTVTAEDNVTTKTYRVVTTRGSPSTCVAPDLAGRKQVWTGTLTIDVSSFLGVPVEYGFVTDANRGNLSESDFDVGTNSYTIDRVTVGTGSITVVIAEEELQFSLTGALTAEEKAKLSLHVCNAAFAFSNANYINTATTDSDHTYSWTGTGFVWAPITTRMLYLSVPLSTVATLSDLDLAENDGTAITLSPTFAPATTSYTAAVANTVDEITIAPTVNDSNAEYEIQDSGGTALTDADSNTTGFQVALSEGANTIKVEVTAEDGRTPETYTVVVTRELMTTTPTALALSIADASAAENAGHLLFDVTLSRSLPNTVKVDFETISGGTATEGEDYHARRTYTHVIVAGNRTVQMGFALIEDTVDDAEETVKVRLSNARVVDAYGDKIKVLDITTAEATGTITAPLTSTTNVPGLTIGIKDATGDEDDGWLDFRVRLSRKYDKYVCYDFETISGGTATEGRDYIKRPKVGQWMQTGKRVDKPFVRIIDDSVNDNGETVKVKISNAHLCGDASKTVSITRAEATGTINNTDPMPLAWMVRFGRTVGSQVVDALGQRLDGGTASHVTVGGINLTGAHGAAPEAQSNDAFGLPEWAKGTQREESQQSLTANELVLGSAFHLSSGGGQGEGPAYTAWGRVARSGFEAEVDDVTMDGDVTSGLIGFDAEWERLLAGVMLSQSTGEGSYRLSEENRGRTGTVESSLTGVYPYVRLELNRQVSAWALAGTGSGELTLQQEGDKAMPTDITMRMGAVGFKGQVLDGTGPSGLAMNVKSDAMWVGTQSERTADMVATQGDVTRLRVILEGERAFDIGGGATLTPSAEVGLRHDAGDAETGTGLEMGAGLSYTAGPLTVEGQVRMLVAHEESGYEEWGASGAMRITPSASGRGLTLSIAPQWGRTGSATEQLWSARDASAIGTDRVFEGDARLALDAGYGVGVGHGVLTPYAGLTLGDAGSRTVRTGMRWQVTPDAVLGLEATRQTSDAAEAANEVRLRAALRF